jgi:uncharacterized protein (TIGR02246 family)
MRNGIAWCLAAAAATIVTTSAVRAQQSAPAPSTLAPLDYIEIRQLVARYGYAVDTGADNGYMYADLFAPDGAFLDRAGKATTGRENLAALARRFTRGPQSTFHFLVNHVIEAAAGGGATGKEYLVQLRIGEPGRANDIFGGGRYDDRYEKTSNGWRFKSRQFFPAEPPTAAAPAGLAR